MFRVSTRPADMFDRVWEWEALSAFAEDPVEGALLGVVSGRRRQGKSFLLEELCRATDGFYFVATEATATDSLRLLAEAIADHQQLAAPLALRSWEEAVDALLALGQEWPVPVVLDEFPYLCKAAPELPSVIQKAFGPRRRARLRSRARLILCGSALSFMGRLLSGTAPLRGRASLDLPVRTFDHRTAAEFWGIDDWRLALQVHAVVGGTPAYRREYVRGDAPGGLKDFDSWIVRTVLNPANPLFREARYLLAEEPDLRDLSLYHSVLAAVAEGNATRSHIASYIGRKADTLRHPITVLEDAGLLVREEDVFRQTRPTYRIAEPLLAFYHAVMRPEWSRLEQPGRADQVWEEASGRYYSAVLGPHFESLCREWVRRFADSGTFGGPVAVVGAGVVNDTHQRRKHEVDVAVLDPAGRLLSIGEAKLGTRMGPAQLDRLRRIRELLGAQLGVDVAPTRLACYSAEGFTRDLVKAEAAGEVVLVDLTRLYTGD
jgi:AAA+ ATPase superfamily predicted ATPase